MAGQSKQTVIEYVFQGNTLDLQAAVKKVQSTLTSSVKQLKNFQDGTLNATQTNQQKVARSLLKVMKGALANVGSLTEEQKKEVLRAGREALKQAENLAKQSRAVADKAAKAAAAAEDRRLQEAQEREEKIASLTSIAGQTAAEQQAAFLNSYSNKLQKVIGQEAFDAIQKEVATYREAVQQYKEGKISQEQLADSTERLNQTYKDYSSTLQTANRQYQASSKGIHNLNQLIVQAKAYVTQLTQSFSFWLTILRKVFDIFKQGFTDASAFVESLNFLNVTIGESNQQFRDFLSLQQQAFGISPTELNETAATFYSFGNALGFTKEQTDITATGLTKLAEDLASLRNTDLTEMTIALRSAMAGNTRPLMRFGIAVHDASVEEWLLSKGIVTSMESMSEASQAAARYAFILDKTKSAQGDLARTIESPANQLKILKTQLKLLAQNLASTLIPLFTAFMRVANGVLQPVNAFLEALTSVSKMSITASIGEGTDALEDYTDAANEATKGLAGFDEVNVLGARADTAALSGVQEDIAALIKDYENGAVVGSQFIEIAKEAGEALGPILAQLGDPLTSLLEVIGSLTPALSLLLVPFGAIATAIAAILHPLTALFEGLKSSDEATRAWSIAGVTAIGVFTALAGVLKLFAFAVKLGNGSIAEGIKFMIKYIAESIRATAAKIKETIATKAAAIAEWWHNASLAAKIVLVSAGVGVALVASAGIAAAVMSAKSQETASASDANLPGAATGGVVSNPTVAMVGEGQYSEAIVPLENSPQFTSMKEEIATITAERITSNVQGSTGDIKVYVQIGGKSFEDYTYKVVNEQNRRNTGISLEKLSTMARR